MNGDLAIVLGLLCAAIVMFALNKPRMDAVALIMIVALPLTGVVTLEQAVAGFSDPNILLIAALFVVGEGLARTGVAQRMGDLMVAGARASEVRLIALLMLSVATIGSVMSSTGVVAIFIPIVLRVARRARIAPGRLMMPLSVAALISGMMTLVATAPNLVVHGELIRQGQAGFGFFAFTPIGIPVLIVAIGWMILMRRRLGGKELDQTGRERPRLEDWVEAYALKGRAHRVRVSARSSLAGSSLREIDLRGSTGANVIAIERASRFRREVLSPSPDTVLEAGDVLFIDVSRAGDVVKALAERFDLDELPLVGAYFAGHAQAVGMAEVMVPPDSPLVGKSVVSARFRSTYDLVVLGEKHGRTALEGDILDETIRAGDTLLVAGTWRAIRKIAADKRDMIVINLPAEMDDVAPAASRAPFALGALALMIVLMVTGLTPNLVAALIACLLMGLAGCFDFNAAYRSIHWQTLVLIVGILPFAAALEKTGGVAIAADALQGAIAGWGPHGALAGLFLVTALLGMFISNTATAVLMAPVALALAQNLGVSPYPFAMTVALAASAAFMTPVSSPVNTLVVGPGGYGFTDFLRIGVPMMLFTLVVTVLLVPVLMPL